MQSNRSISNSVNSLGFTLMFSVIYLSKTEYKKKLPGDQQRVRSVKQSRLSHATVCLPLREPRFEGKQASCHPRSTKVLEKNKTKRTFKDFSMQQHLLIFMRRHIITVLLFNQCLSSNCADSLLRISKPRYFEVFAITLATSK